jgi:predicted RNase H-like HicB family nuclease
MKHEFTAIFERDDDWYVVTCPEIPEASGLGQTKDEARKSLAEALTLILDERRSSVISRLPDDVEEETVTLN